MKVAKLPSTSFLLKSLRYEAKTGKLFWRIRPLNHFASAGQQRRWNRRYGNKPAFSQKVKWGYLRGNINKQAFLAHRVVWKLVRGIEPPPIIDHVNGIPHDNRIENLRAASASQNAQNGTRSGVSFDTESGKWRVRVTEAGKRRSVGRFESRAAAMQARKVAIARAYGEFARC